MQKSSQHRGRSLWTLLASDGYIGPPLPNPRVATPAYYWNFIKFVSSAKCILLLSKKHKITTVNVLLLLLSHFCIYFFTSNFAVFVGEVARTFFAPGRMNIFYLRTHYNAADGNWELILIKNLDILIKIFH